MCPCLTFFEVIVMAVSLDTIYYTAMRKYHMKLVEGTEGIWNSVTWIHQVEDIEVVGFLKGGELVIVTGISNLVHNRLLEFVTLLIEKEASGLIVNIGPYIKEIPKEVIDLAKEKQFPIFTIPWEVHLVDFNREFCNEIMMRDQKSQNLCGAFQMAIFHPEKMENYMPIMEQEGIDANCRYCMIKCKPDYMVQESINQTKLYYDIRTHFEKTIVRESGYYAIFKKDEYITIVMPSKEKKSVNTLVEKLGRFMKWQNAKGTLYFAVSELSLELSGLSQSYDTMTYMLKMQIAENKTVSYMEDLGILSLLINVKSVDILVNYRNREIGVLEQYDKENGTGYCDILYAYIKCNGKMQEVPT